MTCLFLRYLFIPSFLSFRAAVPVLLSASVQAADEFDGDAVMSSAQERMDKSVESVRLNLETLRTGRAK